MGADMRIHRQADLPEIVGTVNPAAAFPCRLHSRYEETDQDPDNRNDHKQLNKREAATLHRSIIGK